MVASTSNTPLFTVVSNYYLYLKVVCNATPGAALCGKDINLFDISSNVLDEMRFDLLRYLLDSSCHLRQTILKSFYGRRDGCVSHQTLVEVFAPQVGITVGRQDFEHAIVHRQQRHVKRPENRSKVTSRLVARVRTEQNRSNVTRVGVDELAPKTTSKRAACGVCGSRALRTCRCSPSASTRQTSCGGVRTIGVGVDELALKTSFNSYVYRHWQLCLQSEATLQTSCGWSWGPGVIHVPRL